MPTNELSVGMSKARVRDVAKSLIQECSDYVWTLRKQFRPARPGLYPYFDGREVYLYFDEDERLAAIIVRGSYTVYP
jgi:hypothetical protein